MAGSVIRDKMKKFWMKFEPSPKSMMLCSAANGQFESEDRKQVIELCPPLKNKKVLELGAGIGRFTTELATIAKNVTAVDFIDGYIEKNRATNGHFPNVSFITGDVMELEFANHSFDVIFSNWLFMYLSDEEVEKLARKILLWLPEDGCLFIRESCNGGSGDVDVGSNPTYYRTPMEYLKLFQGITALGESEGEFVSGFVCERAVSIEAYVKHYGNPFQIGFVFKKRSNIEYNNNVYDSSQASRATRQYTKEEIRRHEFICGKTFVSPGGYEMTVELVREFNLERTDFVLDVGCGIGGSAFHLAREFGCNVHGVDSSPEMISIALKNQAGMEECVRKLVSFEMSDITKQSFRPDSFQMIYSRDAISNFADKEGLLRNFFKWLKPGGKLMITARCRGFKKGNPQGFLLLLTVREYGQLLEKVGFKKVEADDRTGRLLSILCDESQQFVERKPEFLKNFSEQDFNSILEEWKEKAGRCSNREEAWGHFTATKPLA